MVEERPLKFARLIAMSELSLAHAMETSLGMSLVLFRKYFQLLFIIVLVTITKHWRLVIFTKKRVDFGL